jgi:hypothetical protein
MRIWRLDHGRGISQNGEMANLYSDDTNPSYENFVAICPHCGESCIFNRVSDLHTIEPIESLEVKCLNRSCGSPFNIKNDRINPAYQMLLSDCFALLERKHYMQCVLSVAQAYEVFFNHFFHIQLIYRAFADDEEQDVAHLNELSVQLYNRVKFLTFIPLRWNFFGLVVENAPPGNLEEARERIDKLKNPSKAERRRKIEFPDDQPGRDLLMKLSDAVIDELRNKVVHKEAYRPTREEATSALGEAREILHGLTELLGLGGNVNWHINGSGR